MKKNLIALMILLCGISAYTQINVMAETSVFGGNTGIERRHSDGYSVNTNWNPNVSGFGVNVFWDLAEKKENSFKPFAGFYLGAADWGFPVAGVGGVNFNVAKIGACKLNLMGSVKIGALIELYGAVDMYAHPAIDFIIMPVSGKGFFAGLGISEQTTFRPYWFSSADLISTSLLNFGGHFVMGYKF